MSFRLITLTTDFGASSPYVAAMKGVILSVAPQAQIVDLTHSIPHQDVRQAAWALDDVCRFFPAGTIHVGVVDPGVGSARNIIYAHIGLQHFVAPDNGLLDRLARRETPTKIIALSDPSYWLSSVSTTFHGRDIMAPVAARLSQGLDPDRLGPRQSDLVLLDWPEVHVLPGKIQGSVRSIDSFGNLVTDISADKLAAAPTGDGVRIACDEHETFGIYRTYSDQPEMTLLAIIGSSGYLELAIVGDSAAAMLGVRVGAAVTVSWE